MAVVVIVAGVVIAAVAQARRRALVGQANAQLMTAARDLHGPMGTTPIGMDGIQNGYMHAFAMARAAANPSLHLWSSAEQAYEVFQWREAADPDDDEITHLRKQMDSNNNTVGYNIGSSLAVATTEQVADAQIIQALNSANLSYISGTTLLSGTYVLEYY